MYAVHEYLHTYNSNKHTTNICPAVLFNLDHLKCLLGKVSEFVLASAADEVSYANGQKRNGEYAAKN